MPKNVRCDIVSVWSNSVHLLSRVQLFETHGLRMPGLPVHHQLPEFT